MTHSYGFWSSSARLLAVAVALAACGDSGGDAPDAAAGADAAARLDAGGSDPTLAFGSYAGSAIVPDGSPNPGSQEVLIHLAQRGPQLLGTLEIAAFPDEPLAEYFMYRVAGERGDDGSVLLRATDRSCGNGDRPECLVGDDPFAEVFELRGALADRRLTLDEVTVRDDLGYVPSLPFTELVATSAPIAAGDTAPFRGTWRGTCSFGETQVYPLPTPLGGDVLLSFDEETLTDLAVDGETVANWEDVWWPDAVRLDEASDAMSMAQSNNQFGYFVYAGRRVGEHLSLVGVWDTWGDSKFFDPFGEQPTPAEVADALAGEVVAVCVLTHE